ncbi:MAG: TAXI family TRAP transporter solute-binding subunit [Fusobacteriaceae bacterium]|jgi:TRAP transporter TAXI family solute receptor|nr:TAXI family TRAP transporter solute-binding subunit [Fusobacteriaceae bacterium]
MKKLVSLLAVLVTTALLADTTYINIGTGGTAGTYYPLGGAFAEIWNSKLKDVNATAESTGASVANVNMLQKGDIDVALIQNDIAYYAENGVELFKEKQTAVKGLAILYPEPIQCITLDPNVKSVADLKGKSVAVGAIGSGTAVNATQIMEAAGLKEGDVKVLYLSFAEAVNAMRDGQADAAFQVAGIPTAAIVDLATQKPVRLVEIGADTLKKLNEKYSYYTALTIPGGSYSTVKDDVKTVTVQSMLVVSAKFSEDLVYNMLKALYENQDRIAAAHKMGALIKPESALTGMSIELHPGAVKYYKEKGLLK